MRLITTSSHLGTLIFVVILLSSLLPPVTSIVRTETASIFQFTDTIPQAYYSTDRFIGSIKPESVNRMPQGSAEGNKGNNFFAPTHASRNIRD